jgi:hypothetical protein
LLNKEGGKKLLEGEVLLKEVQKYSHETHNASIYPIIFTLGEESWISIDIHSWYTLSMLNYSKKILAILLGRPVYRYYAIIN